MIIYLNYTFFVPDKRLQRVFVRPSHLYTRSFLSQLRTVPLYTSAVTTRHGTLSAEPWPPLVPRLRHQTGPMTPPRSQRASETSHPDFLQP
jgi:hypothetical protein